MTAGHEVRRKNRVHPFNTDLAFFLLRLGTCPATWTLSKTFEPWGAGRRCPPDQDEKYCRDALAVAVGHRGHAGVPQTCARDAELRRYCASSCCPTFETTARPTEDIEQDFYQSEPGPTQYVLSSTTCMYRSVPATSARFGDPATHRAVPISSTTNWGAEEGSSAMPTCEAANATAIIRVMVGIRTNQSCEDCNFYERHDLVDGLGLAGLIHDRNPYALCAAHDEITRQTSIALATALQRRGRPHSLEQIRQGTNIDIQWGSLASVSSSPQQIFHDHVYCTTGLVQYTNVLRCESHIIRINSLDTINDVEMLNVLT